MSIVLSSPVYDLESVIQVRYLDRSCYHCVKE